MRKLLFSFLLIIIFSTLGIIWGMYIYVEREGLPISKGVRIVKDFIKTKWQTVISKTEAPRETISPPRDTTIQSPEVKTSQETPITPTKIELRKPSRQVVKPQAQSLVDEGDELYAEGIKHLQNTFKKDNTFDTENDLAIEKFRQALQKYLEAEKIDTESLWLRNRIRDTNQNLITCRRQARRK
ncbi:MAG: hypothetical protein QME51_05820 [Planctomycetota bacterium]|nr:hypothetical protein [Planctomycetota bacterium]MDI6787869.1 hypothetical protein [Planctomycetota bacterium]